MTTRPIRQATPEDNAALCRLAAQPMPGAIALSYPHEPDFLRGEALKGDAVHTFVLPFADGTPAGTGTVAVRHVYWNGQASRIGYLGGLRSFPEARRRLGLFQAYRFLHELDRHVDVPFYFTTIVDANHEAHRLLTSRRAGLPEYRPAGSIRSFAITANALRRHCRHAAGAVACGSADWEELRDFYRDGAGGGRQLFPVFPDAPTAWLQPECMLVCRRHGRIVAAAALPDLSDRRQIRVHAYHPWLRRGRKGVNLAARVLGYPELPAPATDLPHRYLARMLIHGNDPEIFAALLAHAAERLQSELLFLALHEADTLQRVLRRIPTWSCRSTLYYVFTGASPEAMDGVPYFELAEI